MLSLNDSPRKRLSFCLLCICSAGLISSTYLAQPTFSANQLVTFEQTTSNGLHRAWFAQARVDSTRYHIKRWTLAENELFALSTSSTVHAMNAETGKTLWIAQVGNPRYPSVGPAANSSRVAILNSSSLYLLDRQDGHVLWTRELGSAAGAAPALSETYAYVGLLSGRMEGYPLESATATAWQYQSTGRIFHPPTTTGQHVAWPTDRGYLYVGDADQPRVAFRVETNEDIIAAPAEWDSLFYVASLDGYLYCFDGSTGTQLWRYSTGMAIISKPVVIDNIVYVASEMPTLHAIDAITGNQRWTLDGAVQFVAQGSQHIYASDRYDNLLILDKETGGVAGQINTPDGISPLVNEQSDRIFLVSKTGLIQCLHEIGADKPTFHRHTADEEEKPTKDRLADEATSPAEETPEDTDNPFAAEEAPADENENPFGTDETSEESTNNNLFDNF